jgi:hypothetical protein
MPSPIAPIVIRAKIYSAVEEFAARVGPTFDPIAQVMWDQSGAGSTRKRR